MNMSNEELALSQVLATLPKLDLELPARLVEALADADELPNKVATDYDSGALVEAVAAAADAGRDPATDPEVVTHLMRRVLKESNVYGMLTQAAHARRHAALRDALPELLDALARVVDDAHDALSSAVETFGDRLDLDASSFVTGLGRDGVATWQRARNAASAVDGHVLRVWRLLTQAFRLPTYEPATKPLVLAEVDAEAIDELRGELARARKGHGDYPWSLALVCAGYRLALATPEEFASRRAAVVSQRQAAQARADREARTGQREEPGLRLSPPAYL